MTHEININHINKFEDMKLAMLILGREGGKTTARIIDELLIRPNNKNQLAKILNLDYNTITYHLDIMDKHSYVIKEQFEKNIIYYPSDKFYKKIEEYLLIRDNLLNKN